MHAKQAKVMLERHRSGEPLRHLTLVIRVPTVETEAWESPRSHY